ncbi:uncharacterized protein LOC131675606 isoform X2 [Phymastichus coffea]|uniref:uncharacterized protein LOC131675606 isoform X2 n=1 Tax=Phymastichus coffea TaxID=108790 RepID=UPI00273B7930|nr:uncharacterized protein LOC131675606 isoform X2 [Phymastichus coffea]
MDSESSSVTRETIENNEMLNSTSTDLNDYSSLDTDSIFRSLRQPFSDENQSLNNLPNGGFSQKSSSANSDIPSLRNNSCTSEQSNYIHDNIQDDIQNVSTVTHMNIDAYNESDTIVADQNFMTPSYIGAG